MGNRTLLEVDRMVVSWWIVAVSAVYTIYIHSFSVSEDTMSHHIVQCDLVSLMTWLQLAREPGVGNALL